MAESSSALDCCSSVLANACSVVAAVSSATADIPSMAFNDLDSETNIV